MQSIEMSAASVERDVGQPRRRGLGRPGANAGAIRHAVPRALLVLPSVALLLVAFGWPLFTIAARSLNREGLASVDGGLYFGHYHSLLADELLRRIAIRTALVAAVSTAFTVLLAFPAAYLITRVGRRLSSVLLLLVLTPFWVSVLVRLFAFTSVLGREGMINDLFGLLGLGPYDLLFNTRAAVIGMVAFLLPVMVLILAAAMAGIDPTLTVAAHTMGARPQQAFWHIYFPQIRAALASGAMLVFVVALGFFLTPAILGGPRDLTIPMYIQQQIDLFQWGRASAGGIALLVAALIAFGLAIRIGGASVLGARSRLGTRGVASPTPFRGPARIVCWVAMVVVLLLLLVPMAVVIPSAFGTTTQIQFPPKGFTLDWFGEVLGSELWRTGFYKSVRVGLATSVLATALGLALARFGTTLKSNGLRGSLQVVVLAPTVVPVILLAIGIFDVQTRIGLLGSDIGLVLAHSVICLPLTFLISANALSRVDPSLEEAAWSIGVRPFRAFWTITMPAIRPAVMSSLLISFMTSWDEAVIALFQVGLEKTLPVNFYSQLRSGVSPAVAAVAVLLMVPVFVGMAVVAASSLRKSRSAEVGGS